MTGLRDGRIGLGGYYKLVVWDPFSSRVDECEGPTDWTASLAELANGDIVVGSEDFTIRVFSAPPREGRSNEYALREKICLSGHRGSVSSLVEVSEGVLASSSGGIESDGTVRLWNLATGAQISRLDLDVSIVAMEGIGGGRLVARDMHGALHWIAIKGMETCTVGAKGGEAEPPATAAPAQPTEEQTTTALMSAPKPQRHGGLWSLVILTAVIALAAAILGTPALNDIVQVMRATSAGP